MEEKESYLKIFRAPKYIFDKRPDTVKLLYVKRQLAFHLN